MKKLGFVLKNTGGGAGQEAFSYNKDISWDRYTDDVRDAIGCLDGFDGTGKTVYYVRFLGTKGYLFAIIQGTCGRQGDNSAAWIHVPADVELPAEKMLELVNDVPKAAFNSLGPEKKLLREMFERTVLTKKVVDTAVKRIESSQRGSYAIRYYGCGTSYTRKEFLGDNIAQSEYAEYKGVFFVDKESRITRKDEREIKEINGRIKPIVTLPSLTDKDGFVPSITIDGNPIERGKGIEVEKGTQVTVKWKKVGYEEMQESGVVNGNEWPVSVFFRPDEVKVVTLELDLEEESRTVSVDHQNIISIDISVKYKSGSPKKPINDKLDEFKKITKEHFESQSNPGENDDKESKNNSSKKGRVSKWLKFFWEMKQWKKIVLLSLGGVAILVIAVLGFMCYNKEITNVGKNSSELVNGKPSGSNECSLNNDTVAAVNYLKVNTVLKKDSMECYNATRGMFEELRTGDWMKLQKRMGKWNNMGSTGDTLTKLREYVRKLENGKVSAGGSHLFDGDSIKRKEYIEILKELLSPKDKNEEHSDVDKSGKKSPSKSQKGNTHTSSNQSGVHNTRGGVNVSGGKVETNY